MKNKFALWSFIVGILSIADFILFYLSARILGFIWDGSGWNPITVYSGYFLFILGLLSLILGILGIKRAQEKNERIFSIIGVVIGILISLLLILGVIASLI